ncbi:MAG: response regulator [Limnothrix sp. RL_2_0]|nr:response regulator [Limnothrix sp. RL_2_0]
MTNPEFTNIIDQIDAVNRRQKEKLLVVDDEPDNLDLLYRTFRRDFQVLKASNGIEALKVLEEEGEVAVIISDQRMPEMKGTEFLSRTVPQFPNTVRIILTGFTDVEDLVEAINAGQVYRYITKPWDPSELKKVVKVAADTYTLANDRLAELATSKSQRQLFTSLLQVFSTEEPLKQVLDRTTEAIAPALNADGCLLRIVKEGEHCDITGMSNNLPVAIALPETDPLITAVKKEQTMQMWINSYQAPPPKGIEYYQTSKIQQHLLLPLIHRQELLALLSLQWLETVVLKEADLNLLNLVSQQIAFVLVSQKAC